MPPPPGAVWGVFSSRAADQIQRYAEMLATDGVVRGLIGPREVPRLWERHILNCALLAPLIRLDASVCDIGSGAGLPGLVLAVQRPDLAVVLVEPLLRRTTFLQEVVDALGLENAEVVRGRADLLHGKRLFDVVTSRAVAPLPRLLEWSMPLVGAGGELIALKGSSVEREIAEAGPELARHGCSGPVVQRLGGEEETVPTFALRVSRADPLALPLGVAAGGRSRKGSGGNRRGRRAKGPGVG